MATIPHCLYCFDALQAYLDRRQPLPLQKIEALYEKHQRKQNAPTRQDGSQNGDGDHEQVNGNGSLSNGHSNGYSSYAAATSALPKMPLFITWNIFSKSGRKDLRGCIGTFEPKNLETGLKDYALTAGLHDTRFDPISARELPRLECGVTLLTDFEQAHGSMDWELGKHGLQIDFVYHGKRMGATYLPDVPKEQGWTKEETLISLMRKAGWTGRRDDWKKVDLRITRYQGSKASALWEDYKELMEDLDAEEEDEDEDEEDQDMDGQQDSDCHV